MSDTLTVYRCWWSRGWVAQLGKHEIEADCPLLAAQCVLCKVLGWPDPRGEMVL